MKYRITILLVIGFVWFYPIAIGSADENSTVSQNTVSDEQQHKTDKKILDQVLQKVEQRYNANGFSATFFQESTIKAMDITDTAVGKAFFKRPGMMRWIYESPYPQRIITDGKDLWIFRPEENQVMVGKAPTFFGDGKGASFLSDIRLIRLKFDIQYAGMDKIGFHLLKLVPLEKGLDLSKIHLSISAATYEVVEIVTFNSYQDKTRITFNDIKFREDLDNAMFRFKIPQGVDVLGMDE